MIFSHFHARENVISYRVNFQWNFSANKPLSELYEMIHQMANYDCRVCGGDITNDERSPLERDADILEHFANVHSNDRRVNILKAFSDYLIIQE